MKPNHLKIVTFWVDTWLKLHKRYPPVLTMSVDVLAEVADLAQVDCTHVNDMNWENVYRAVVCHIANLPDDIHVIASHPRGDTMCVAMLHRWAGCPSWHAPDACDRLWHAEFIEVILNETPTWFWVPRLVICRQHQRALGLQRRQGDGVLTCTDPNCTRAHAPDWHRAELLAFHWLVKHHRLAGLGVGYALDGSLVHMSQRQARRILADMPYVDEEFYHSFRWHKPIPAPRPYGDMIVTATSRRANLNEQPRRRDTTPRRANTPRRSPSRPRHGSPRPRPHQDHPASTPPRKAPPVAPPVAEPYDVTRDPWATPTPYPESTPAPAPTRPNPPELPTVITPAVTPRRNKMTPPDPLAAARETLSHYVPTTVESVPRPVPPPARPINIDITQATALPMDPMTQSWQVVSGFPATPTPPRIPDALADLWLQRPPDNFTALVPPTHPAGQHGLLRSDSPFRIYSQLLNEFTDWVRTSRPDLPLHLGPWGSILQAPMRRDPVTNASYYDRIQMIPMASETATADESIMKFWWHQWLLRTRADAQQRFATQNDGATIITDHIQAWLMTAVNLMQMARPEPDYRLPQPHGPALEIMATALLDTLLGTIPLEMRMGIAAGNIGEVHIHANRLVFTRPINERMPSNTSTIDLLDIDEVET